MKYDKLVRDKIPDILKSKNLFPKFHIAWDYEYWLKLKDKLSEEVNEFIKDSNEEELIDILEVLKAIIKFKNFDDKSIEMLRERKEKEKGSFNKKIILEEA